MSVASVRAKDVRDLKQKMAVAPLMQELARQREAAKQDLPTIDSTGKSTSDKLQSLDQAVLFNP